MAKKKVLLMGKAHSGKTSMRSIIFANYLARDTTRLSPTLDVEHHHVRFLGDLVLNLWDCGGQDAFYESYFERDRETIFRSVELLIYVFDIESDCPEKDFDHFCGVLEAIEENSPDARVFILIHKMDLVALEDRQAILEDRKRLIEESCASCGVENFQCFGTSIWDETLYKAWSEIVTNLIPNIRLLESHLNYFCNVCDADEVVLFERATFLVISHAQATDQYYSNANAANSITNHANANANANALATKGTTPLIATGATADTGNDGTGTPQSSQQQLGTSQQQSQDQQLEQQSLKPPVHDGTSTTIDTTNNGGTPISSSHTAASMDHNQTEDGGDAPAEIQVASLASSPRTTRTEDETILASSVDAHDGHVSGGDLIVDNASTAINPASNDDNKDDDNHDNHDDNQNEHNKENDDDKNENNSNNTNNNNNNALAPMIQNPIPNSTIPRHISRTPHFDAHRFEKISNIVKQFKLSCGKAQSQFEGMQVRNSRFSAFIDAFTANTYIMVIVSNPRVHTAAILLNIQNARNHFERFIPRI